MSAPQELPLAKRRRIGDDDVAQSRPGAWRRPRAKRAAARRALSGDTKRARRDTAQPAPGLEVHSTTAIVDPDRAREEKTIRWVLHSAAERPLRPLPAPYARKQQALWELETRWATAVRAVASVLQRRPPSPSQTAAWSFHLRTLATADRADLVFCVAPRRLCCHRVDGRWDTHVGLPGAPAYAAQAAALAWLPLSAESLCGAAEPVPVFAWCVPTGRWYQLVTRRRAHLHRFAWECVGGPDTTDPDAPGRALAARLAPWRWRWRWRRRPLRVAVSAARETSRCNTRVLAATLAWLAAPPASGHVDVSSLLPL